MKESQLELDALKLAERLGYIVYKGDGRVGAPDKIFTKANYVFFVEFKNPSGKGVQSDAQKHEQECLTNNGSSYHLCDNLDDFASILTKHEKHRLYMVSLVSKMSLR